MKTWWSGNVASRILKLGTWLRLVVSFTPRPLYPQERSHGTHLSVGCMSPRAGLDAVAKKWSPSTANKD